MKADLHIHTHFSPDSNSEISAIISRCQKVGIDCLAITDHGTIQGALVMKKKAPFKIIVGEEVMSADGEIIGYFLHEEIPNGLPPEEVIDRIKSQGGLVCLPHPFDGFGRHPLKESKREKLIDQVDIIEVFNTRSLSDKYPKQALAYAESKGLLKSAGSDAHAPRQVGKAYVEMPDFDGPEEFKASLAKGRIYGKRDGYVKHFLTTLETVPKRLRNGKYV